MSRCRPCDVCGKVPGDGDSKWIILNRYGVGTGKSACMSEVRTDDDYWWDADPDEWTCSHVMLCYPECLMTFLEAKMVQVDFEAKR